MPTVQKRHTLAQESLNQAAVGTPITSTDVEGFPYGHEGHNRVEEQRRNLNKKYEYMRLRSSQQGKELLTKKPIVWEQS